MKTQLREIVDNSVKALVNYFKNIFTITQIQNSNKPLRRIRPVVTREDFDLKQREKKKTYAQKQEEAMKSKNAALALQLEKRKSQEAKRKEEDLRQNRNIDIFEDKNCFLYQPDYMDYQDFMTPIFHLDLYLAKELDPNYTNIVFTKSEEFILEGFEKLITKTVTAFNEFSRPEFCKVF